MAILNADELISDIAARTRRQLEENTPCLLRGNGSVQSEYAAFDCFYNHRGAGEASRLDMNELQSTRHMCLPIYTNPLMPAYKARVILSRKLDVSEKFRADTNEWLRHFFGEEPYAVIARPPGLGVPGCQEAIFCNPRIEGEIRRRQAPGEMFV